MKTGFIGLGAMGMPMARNLARAGLLAAVWNRTHAKAEQVARETGCAAPADFADFTARCEAVVLCVPADADVLDLAARLAPQLAPGALVIDCSTVSAATARRAATMLAEHGIDFLDCPVSGGTEGARDATLAIMCGGEPAVFARARPVLAALGRRIVHMGPVGAGQATKAVNQVLVAGINQAVSEALAFAQAEGLPLERVIEAVSSGAAGSWFLTHRGPNMARDHYPLGFRITLHRKDLEIVQAMAAAHGVQLPLVEMTLLHYRRLIEAGHGDEDVSALFRLKRRMFEK